MLQPFAEGRGVLVMEFGFRALPEYEARRADVAFITYERLEGALAEDEFFGAPDLVIEVLSPSNTAAEIDDKEALCLANGCREFWVVNERRQTVRVTRPGEPVRWYRRGDSIPLEILGGGEISVEAIFDLRLRNR